MDLELDGRAFIVTGGSRGIGFAGAQALVANGAKVVLNGRDQGTLEKSAEHLGCESVAGDLADPNLADRLVATCLEAFGRLDGAFISVGGPPAGTAMNVTEEQWRAGFESVFLGTIRLMTTVARSCTDGGSIAVVLSTSSKSLFSGLTISNGYRPGLAMVIKDLADEVGPRGVRVNGLMPGKIATDRLNAMDASTGDAKASRERAEATIPLRRYGEPEEFGKVAAFILSPAASYISGAIIPIDGGLLRTF